MVDYQERQIEKLPNYEVDRSVRRIFSHITYYESSAFH